MDNAREEADTTNKGQQVSETALLTNYVIVHAPCMTSADPLGGSRPPAWPEP